MKSMARLKTFQSTPAEMSDDYQGSLTSLKEDVLVLGHSAPKFSQLISENSSYITWVDAGLNGDRWDSKNGRVDKLVVNPLVFRDNTKRFSSAWICLDLRWISDEDIRKMLGNIMSMVVELGTVTFVTQLSASTQQPWFPSQLRSLDHLRRLIGQDKLHTETISYDPTHSVHIVAVSRATAKTPACLSTPVKPVVLTEDAAHPLPQVIAAEVASSDSWTSYVELYVGYSELLTGLAKSVSYVVSIEPVDAPVAKFRETSDISAMSHVHLLSSHQIHILGDLRSCVPAAFWKTKRVVAVGQGFLQGLTPDQMQSAVNALVEISGPDGKIYFVMDDGCSKSEPNILAERFVLKDETMYATCTPRTTQYQAAVDRPSLHDSSELEEVVDDDEEDEDEEEEDPYSWYSGLHDPHQQIYRVTNVRNSVAP